MEEISIASHEGYIENHGFKIMLGKTIIGVFMFSVVRNDERNRKSILFYNFIVNENHQNKGYGKRAMPLILAKAKELGAEYLILDTMKKNLRAQHVYECLGFEKERETNYCYVYSKKL